MIVAVSGSQGAGKTVLLSKLATTLPNVSMVERKTSRSILADWNVTLHEVNTDFDLTVKFQDEILKRKYQDEQAAELNGGLVFTERTMIDLLVYATVTLGHNNAFDNWLSTYGRSCISITNTLYDHVFYITGGHFDVQADGVRGHNKFYSEMVDAAMIAFYKKHVAYSQLTVINVADLDERVALVQKKLDQLK